MTEQLIYKRKMKAAEVVFKSIIRKRGFLTRSQINSVYRTKDRQKRRERV